MDELASGQSDPSGSPYRIEKKGQHQIARALILASLYCALSAGNEEALSAD